MTNKSKDKKIKKHGPTKNLIIFVIILLIFLGILFFLPVFNITEVNINNNKKTSNTEIVEASGIQEGNNIFRVVSNIVELKIEKLPYVKNAHVSKIYPSTIEINIEERETKFILKFNDKYFFVDEQGYILEVSNSYDKSKVLIEDISLEEDEIQPGNRLLDKNLHKLNDITNILESAKSYYADEEKTITINSIINRITIDNNEYILYSESELKTIYIGTGENLTLKMQNLQSILFKEKGNEGSIYLNMDFLKKNPYFSPKI